MCYLDSTCLQSRRQRQRRLTQRGLQQFFHLGLAQSPRDRKLRNQHMPGSRQHLLFAERKGFLSLQYQQRLQNFGDLEQAAVAHLVRIFLEPVFPIALALADPGRQETKHPHHLAIASNLSQSDLLDMRKRNHHGHAIKGEAKEIKTLRLGPERSRADVLYSADPVVGINDLLTNLEQDHTGTEKTTGCYLPYGIQETRC